jgi:hypothetical protein
MNGGFMRATSDCREGRRQFITSIIPICGAACFLEGGRTASAQVTQEADASPADFFDRTLEEEFTYKRFFAVRYHEFMRLARALEREWGKGELIAFLQKNAEDRRFRTGQTQAQRLEDNSLAAWAKRLRPPAYENLLQYERSSRTRRRPSR